MTGLRKTLLVVAILAIGGSVVYFNVSFGASAGPDVTVEPVTRRSLEAIVSASGTIVPQLTVDISANTMGQVTRLGFNEGDRVQSGEFLLEIDPETLRVGVNRSEAALQASRSAYRQAEVAVESAQVNLDLAQDNLERQEELWELRLVSREAYEQAVNEVALRETELQARKVDVTTQAQRIRQEEANLESARYELTKVTITSPIDGVVTRRNIEEGETVVVGTMNNQGTVLATIADLTVIEAEVEVDETDIPSVRLGQTASVTIDALPDQYFGGVVTEIGNSPIQPTQAGSTGTQATTFKVVVTLNDEIPAVRPGFTCTADITTAVRSNALTIPIQAATVREVVVDQDGYLLRTEQDNQGPGGPPAVGRFGRLVGLSDAGERNNFSDTDLPSDGTEAELEGVFVARQDRAVFVPVDTGIAGERYFEVLSGVTEGDLVITGPFSEVRNLDDGDGIRISTDDEQAAESSGRGFRLQFGR